MADITGTSFQLVGRTVGPGGQVIRGLRVVAFATSDAGRTVIATADSGDDGTFSLALSYDDLLAMFRRPGDQAETWSIEQTVEISVHRAGRRLFRETRRVRLDDALGLSSLGDLRIVESTSARPAFALHIRIATASGRPVAAASVAVRDGSRGSTRTLARGVTNERGELLVEYEGGAEATATHSDRKLRVIVLHDEEERARSAVLFSPPEDEVVELVVRDDLVEETSEFGQISAAITRVLGPASVVDVAADDLEDIARDADVAPTHLALHAHASRMARFGVAAETFYALLRDGLPPSLPALLAAGPERHADALRRAYDNQIISRPTGELDAAIARSTDQLLALAARGLVQTSSNGDTRLSQALEASGVSEATRSAFARAWVSHQGDGPSFWAGLRTSQAIPTRDLESLEFALRSAALVRHHRSSLDALVALRRTGELTSIRDLAAWDSTRWRRFAREHGAPADLPGPDDTQRQRHYADTLERIVEEVAPTPFLAHRFRTNPPRGIEGAAAFLQRNPDFDLIGTSIERYVAEHPDTVGDTADADRVITNVKKVQRVFNLTPRLSRTAVTRALLERGIESAAQIVHMGVDGFVDSHAAALEAVHPQLSGRQVASRIFARASKRHAFSVTLMAQFGASFNTVSMLGVPAYTFDLEEPGFATLRELFGSLDYCACEHCRSVFSPAAYLVDLLALLESRPAVTDGQTALDVLRSRRADLTGIELSCMNTNTVMPYIDLVLEVLEAVAAQPDAELQARQTTWTTPELRVAAEHHDPAAYESLVSAPFPWTLPFALSTERIRAYLRQLGVPRSELMRDFALDADPASATPDLVAESLDMSRHELQLVSGTTAFPPADIAPASAQESWGMAGSAGWIPDLAGDIGRLLDHARLTYDELITLLAIDFINPPGLDPVTVEFDQPSCDLEDAHLTNLTEAALDRIHRFVRLSRNRGVPAQEIDRVIRVLGAGTLDFDLLATLVAILDAAARFRAPVDDLLVLWRPLDTRNYEDELSPYHRLFQNRTVTPELDAAFAATSGAPEIVNPTALVDEHRETLRAALRLNAEDLNRLIVAVFGDDAQLNLASLSTLTRHATLARLLRLRIDELLRLFDVLGIDPFVDPWTTIAFADEVERVRDARVAVDTLEYLLLHRFHPDSGLHPSADDVDDVLTSIVDAAQHIEEDLSAVRGELPVIAATHLSAVFSDAAQVREWVRILALGAAALTATDEAFLQTNFAQFVDAAAVAGAVAQLAGLSGDARFSFAIDLLVTHLRQTRRMELLVQILAATTGLGADAVRVLVGEILHVGSSSLRLVLLDETFLAGGAVGPAQTEAVIRLHKAGHVVRGLGVDAADLHWYFTSPSELQSMDLDALPLSEIESGADHYAGWRRVYRGLSLRTHLGSGENAFMDAAGASLPSDAIAILAAHSSWSTDTLEFVFSDGLLAISQPVDVERLADPAILERIAAVADLVRRTGVEAEVLAEWAREVATPSHADAALRSLRSRYSDEAWPDVITPIADKLRERQRDALLAFIIADTDFNDPLEVYAHYLIDPETAACMLTSRIRLAISSVQLFIQRVLMNLEPDVTFPPETAERWSYIKLYRTWEALRRVFFFPESWVEPDLRDDESPFFEELRQHLNQGEIDDAHVEDGYRSYLRKLHEVSHLETVGIFRELDTSDETSHEIVHVLSRTRGLPYKYFYRTRLDDREWKPWRELPVDIQGDQVTLVAYNRRLFVFWMELSVEEAPAAAKKATSIDQAVKNAPKALKRHYVRIGWTELRDGRWAPKKLTEKSEGYHLASAELAKKHFVLVAWREESDPSVLHVDAMVRKYAPEASGIDGKPDFAWKPMPPHLDQHVTFVGYTYDDCRDELTERTATLLAQFTDNDMGMGQGMAVKSQLHVRRPNDTVLDVLTYHPEQSAPLFNPDGTVDHSGYRHTNLLYNLPLPYRVTVARQRRLYLGDTPLVFDDDVHAFYIAPVYVPVLIEPEGIGVGPTPHAAHVPLAVPIVPGDSSWWERFALLPSAEHRALAAAETLLASRPALAAGPAPWSGRVPGLAAPPRALGAAALESVSDAEIATRSLAVARGVVGASTSLAVATAVESAPAEGVIVYQRRWRIDPFHHPYTCSLLALLNRHGIAALFTKTDRQRASHVVVSHEPGAPAARPYRPSFFVSLPDSLDDYDFSFGGAYSVYNWELFFHAPLLIADRLRREGRFSDAQRWYHYIFDPTRGTDEGVGPYRFWNIKPLFDEAVEGPIDVIRTIFSDDGLQTDPKIAKSFFDSIQEWLAHPFSPHAIARVRFGTYQKVVVRKYLDNLIEWGDSLFRQDTIESINEATQIYLLAAAMLGERPRQLREIHTPVRTYDDLGFPILFGGLTELEGFYPAELPSDADGPHEAATPPTPPVWWYFCLPPNDKLLEYWNIVGDRLFKIRHCQNIEGIERQLRLFEPPIDPALLVKAVAAGVDLGAALADLHGPLPPYRYAALIGRALDLAADVRALGGALLAALEKKDAERIALLRIEHEIALLEAMREVRTAQVREAEATLEAWRRQQDVVDDRGRFYRGREKISALEKASLALNILAAAHEITAQGLKGLGGTLSLVPDFDAGVLAIIPLTKVSFGGKNVGPATGFVGEMIAMVGAALRQGAQTTAILGDYARRHEDWQFQGKQADLETKQLEKQIAASQIRCEMANTELRNHDRQTEQSRQIDEVMRSKFTNVELHDWMIGQISSVHFQSYKLAYDLAKKAERAMQFELGREDLSFITFGYWDSLKRGLMAGELLHHALKRMDAAYADHNRRDLELTKRVSLRRIDPAALLALHETASCTFALDEILFDLDHPGHYFRRIKSVSLSLNATVDDHTSPGAKLSLIGDQIRLNTQLAPDYPRNADAPLEDVRFRDGVGGIQSIATSRGRDDAGLFELNFRDERYLPFEGAGAVSRWRLELPGVAQFDYRSISDVEIHLHYTARDGGAGFRAAATSWVEVKIQEVIDIANETGLMLLLSARKNFATAWERFLRPVEGQVDAPLPIPIVPAKFPFVARSRGIEVDAVELVFVTAGGDAVVLPSAGAATLAGPQGSSPVDFSAIDRLVRGAVDVAGPVPLDADTLPWDFAFGDGAITDPDGIEDLLVFVRYHIVTG